MLPNGSYCIKLDRVLMCGDFFTVNLEFFRGLEVSQK